MTVIVCQVGIYWQFDTLFGRKWEYCANLFNEIMILNVSEKKYYQLEYLRSTLAIDLCSLDLVKNKSFDDFFLVIFRRAATHSNLKICYIDNLCVKNQLREDFVLKILNDYQSFCFDKINKKRVFDRDE
ncbi:hypothetical protein [Bacteriovorax sp. BSW11_IV]|uniref:hypothetical protein n=1 Tax=Bacteriovorax sp. BSW11_IV TaxID=1353529 RepID=UPI0005573C5C|nr:hypothetical protein [Bacteriovorax sp. BSW11_IV]